MRADPSILPDYQFVTCLKALVLWGRVLGKDDQRFELIDGQYAINQCDDAMEVKADKQEDKET